MLFSRVEDDCNNYDSSVYPGAEEICDGKDNDCDGSVDEGLTCVATMTGTAASPNTALMFMPGAEPTGSLHTGSLPTGSQDGAMAADYGVWVRDARTAYLLSWDGSAWSHGSCLALRSSRPCWKTSR